MVKDIDKKIKKQPYYIGIIIGLVIIAVALFSFIYANDKSISDTTKDYADFKLNSALSIEIYDFQSGELIAKYEDESSIGEYTGYSLISSIGKFIRCFCYGTSNVRKNGTR